MFRPRSAFRRSGLIIWLLRLLLTILLPILIYNVVSPHLSEVNTLLLAALPPALLTLLWFLVRRKISLLGSLALLTIALKLADALFFQNTTVLLLIDPMLMGGLGMLLLGSLLLGRPLLSTAATALADQIQQGSWQKRLREQGTALHASLVFLTGLAGVTLLLQAVVHSALVLLLPVEHFGLAPLLLLKKVTTYGLFGIALLVLLGYLLIQRHKSHRSARELLSPQQSSKECSISEERERSECRPIF